ncbi:MAG: glycerol 3-phosphate dehydrogenase [Proteobacteria bacterium]|nr:glycerol 3-phosphate dehydrogenase [Pseudomonadota bacterium]
MKLSVLAAGAWGTALAIAFSERHRVVLWTQETEVAADLMAGRENRRYLPGHRVPEGVEIATDFDQAVAGAELLVIAAPFAGLRPLLKKLRALSTVTPVLWVCKGFEAGSGLLAHQVAAQELPADAVYGVLSGPSFAEEVAAGRPTAVSLAANNPDFARRMTHELHGTHLRIYANDDLVGVEVGGAVKNVLAIATGVCDGLGLGLNSRAALLTRGLAEIARLGEALGARRDTFMGLSGLGDLILTCTGDLSRNRRVGLALAEGKTLEQAVAALGHVAEGVHTAREVERLAAQLGVDMPICAAVSALLAGRLTAHQAVEQLMARDPKQESA